MPSLSIHWTTTGQLQGAKRSRHRGPANLPYSLSSSYVPDPELGPEVTESCPWRRSHRAAEGTLETDPSHTRAENVRGLPSGATSPGF